ncbi:MAG: hypothetical protein KKH83_03790 [Candidatus Margulisbacteria bacterium]|nr:hypothetical protein [Candidatus Margulisiibacteriota bacterium]
MKKIAVLLLIALFVCQGISFASAPLDYKVTKLFQEPSAGSKLVYEIPVEVRLVDISEDANWYKVKIFFNLGPVRFAYEGWAEIPVGETLLSRLQPKPLAELPQEGLP